jgi:hypothetical protein
MDLHASRRTSVHDPVNLYFRSSSSDGARTPRNRHSWGSYTRSADSSPRRHEQASSSRPRPGHSFDPSHLLPVEGRSHSAPVSRAPSPEPPRGRQSSRSSVPNFSRVLSQRSSVLPTIMEHKGGSSSADSLKSRLQGTKIKRWDSNSRTTTPWDGLRRVRKFLKSKSGTNISNTSFPRIQSSGSKRATV